MAERRFLLVDAEVLPEVFVKVLQAKELLASGAVSNISAAAKQAGISRSAFYKYKDTVFDAETGRESITVVATLLDKTGALQSLLSGISAAGASIVTITQSRPENGAAQVERYGPKCDMELDPPVPPALRGGDSPRGVTSLGRRGGARHASPANFPQDAFWL